MLFFRRYNIYALLVTFVISYVAATVFIYLFQRSMIYFPDTSRALPSVYNMADMDVVEVTTDDNISLNAWYKPPSNPDKAVILMFHGNSGNIGARGYKARPFLDKGYGFMFAEYRGYGGSKGSASEEGLYKDGRAHLRWLLENGIKKENIVLYGESLGTGVATQLAVENSSTKALVLEAPYTSLPDIGQSRFVFLPVNLLMKDRYNNIGKIKDINSPLLILHGNMDMVVPYKFGKKLYEAANEPKVMESFPMGSHNNLYSFGAAAKIIDFLDDIDL